MKTILFLLVAIFTVSETVGQVGLTDEMKETEAQLRASTKQVNQFFRRFNGEEDENGKRYYETDKQYRSASLRRKFMPVLFDTQTSKINPDAAMDFIKLVTDKKSPQFLDFHQDDWFAEVSTTFMFKGKEIKGLLFMKLQQQGQGYEWVIQDVAFHEFQKIFNKDTTETKKFIHPMSHELDFMTLRKAFLNEHAEQFTPRDYTPDFLSIFLYEMNLGNLRFETVHDVRFHFFSINGYYFSLYNFNRPGYNSGWLISGLVPLENDAQIQELKDFIYDKN
ncbi:MAG: hypothetical protein RIG77_24275 [Cyclobacteriaceae bacterium]